MARKRNQKKKDLEKRLAGYSLAAGAVLAMTASSSAEVIRTDVDTRIAIGESFDIDFDGSGDGADIQLVVDGSTSTSYSTFTETFTITFTNTHTTTSGSTYTTTSTTTSTSTHQYNTYTNINTLSIRADRIKNSVSFIGSGTGTSYAYPYALGSSKGVTAAGPWTAASTNQLDYSYGAQGDWDGRHGFLGVKFKIDDKDHYGWVRMTCSAGGLTIREYAYETIPGVGIPSIAASLPVTLAAFNAVADGAGVVLNWATETEENNLGFILERKSDGGAWAEIASFSTHEDLRGSGTSAHRNEYAFTDTGTEPGKTYHYRLKDVDATGTETVLGVVTSAPDDGAGITLQPVSAAGGIQGVRYRLATDAHVNLTIMNIMGRNIRQLADTHQPAGTYTVFWDGKDGNGRKTASGTYLLVLRSGDTVVTQKIQLLGR